MSDSTGPVTFLQDFGMDFAVRCVLSGVRNRMAEVGEVLALCDRVVDGDAESWVREWHELADRCDAIGDASAAAGQSTATPTPSVGPPRAPSTSWAASTTSPLADRPLADLRTEFHILPKAVPGPGFLD